MKVGELIELLKEHDLELELLIDTRALSNVVVEELNDYYKDGYTVINIGTQDASVLQPD